MRKLEAITEHFSFGESEKRVLVSLETRGLADRKEDLGLFDHSGLREEKKTFNKDSPMDRDGKARSNQKKMGWKRRRFERSNYQRAGVSNWVGRRSNQGGLRHLLHEERVLRTEDWST